MHKLDLHVIPKVIQITPSQITALFIWVFLDVQLKEKEYSAGFIYK